MRLSRSIRGAILATLLASRPGAAQTTTQLWSNITLDWVTSPSVTYELDFEPKVLISAPPDQPGWSNLDTTPSIEYAVSDKVDLVAELTTGLTKQTDDVNTFELTPRAGLRFHLFSRQQHLFLKERRPKRRLVIRDLVRVEARTFFYSDDHPTDSTARFRNRLELLFPINRPTLAEDGTVHLFADWEWFIPVSDQAERFANRQRIRGGVGFRRNTAWRFAAVYIRNRSRNTTDEPFTTSENVFNLQVKRVWQD